MLQSCRVSGTHVWRTLPSSRIVAGTPRPVFCSKIMNNQVQKPDERVQIVDESNNPTGAATRSDMRAKNLIHRCSFTMIFNSQGDLYVQKRVAFKETYASHYDPAPGGVVEVRNSASTCLWQETVHRGEGESYEENAAREIEEEMGVTGVDLERQLDFFYSDTVCRLWGRLFRCQCEGPFKLDPEEVESGQFMSLEEVAELLRSGPVCPDSKAAVEQYLRLHAPALKA